MKETFNVNTAIPSCAEGAIVDDKLYTIGGSGPVKQTSEIDTTKK